MSSSSAALPDVDNDEERELSVFSLNSKRGKPDPSQMNSLRRLMKDYKELLLTPIPFVHAAPLDNDLFCWHGNIRGPSQSPFEGGIFHITILVSANYPAEPPKIKIGNKIPHPFVHGDSLCLDMLEQSRSAFSGWTPAYSIQSILLQLQSFLLDGLEASQISTGRNVEFSQKQTSAWKMVFENRDKKGEGTLIPEEVRELMLEVGERKPSSAELALYYKMLNLPSDQPIDFPTFLLILEKKREYRKVVEEANRFSCPEVKCGHKQHLPKPPFPELSDEDFRLMLSEQELIKKEIQCFFSKKSIFLPDKEILGVGISFVRNPRDGTIHSIDSPLDLLSLHSFRKKRVLKSVDNSRSITHWLPVFIEPTHGKKCMHLLPRSLGIICSGSHYNFQPEMILQILPKLMSGILIRLAKGTLHFSFKVLQGYLMFHRLFLAAVKEFPELRGKANERVQKFVSFEEERHKKLVPNLSDFACLLTVLDVKFDSIFTSYLQEAEARTAAWILKQAPELDCPPNPRIDKERPSKSFDLSASSFKIMLMIKFFNERLTHRNGMSFEEICEKYDNRFGYPTEDLFEEASMAIKQIQKVTSFTGFYLLLGLDAPTDGSINQRLHDAIKRAKQKNYHGKKVLSLTSPDEYTKSHLKNFPSLESLIQDGQLSEDEPLWKEMCGNRYGVSSLPEYHKKIEFSFPWRHEYLKQSLESILEKLNDNPDFSALYKILELASPYIKVLEYRVNPTSNIKSGYYFLKVVLAKLKNLEKLVIKKGDAELGLKGSKHLCKGLEENGGSIRYLDLHYTYFSSECIEILQEGLSACKQLISLNLEGNPLNTDGAKSIAKVIMRHQVLKDLDLSSCNIDRIGAEHIAFSLYHNKSIVHLKFSKNPVTMEGLSKILSNLAYSSCIKSIFVGKIDNISRDASLSTAVSRLLEVNLSLKSLNFFGTAIGSTLNKDTIHALEKNRSIEVLDLCNSRISREHCFDLGRAVAGNQAIKRLYLNENLIGEDGFTQFSQAIYSSLKEESKLKEKKEKGIELSQSEIEEDLRPHDCKLQHVNFSKNQLNIAGSSAAQALTRFISFTESLVSLDLSHTNLGVVAGESIGAGLKDHLNLLTLNLSGNSLGEHGTKKLFKGLASNTVLQKLDLTSNSIGGRGAGYISEWLQNEKSKVSQLILFGNFIGIEGARSIATAITVNKTLTYLDLGLNRIRAKGAVAIANSIKANSTLKTLNLKLNFINDKAAIALAQSILGKPIEALSSDSEEKKFSTISKIEALSLAGNLIKPSVLAEIVDKLSESAQKTKVDVTDMLKVKIPSRLSKTIYCSPMPADVLEHTIKKIFVDGGCGAIANVTVFSHKKRQNFNSQKYAFVEFADIDSVEVALDLFAAHKTIIGRQAFKVMQAGKSIKKLQAQKVSSHFKIGTEKRDRGHPKENRSSRSDRDRGHPQESRSSSGRDHPQENHLKSWTEDTEDFPIVARGNRRRNRERE